MKSFLIGVAAGLTLLGVVVVVIQWRWVWPFVMSIAVVGCLLWWMDWRK